MNNLKRGEVWMVSGRLGYAGKPCPAVILQDDSDGEVTSATICFFADEPFEDADIRPVIDPDGSNGISARSYLMVDQIITVPVAKVGHKIGVLGETDMLELGRAVIHFWGLDDSSDHR